MRTPSTRTLIAAVLLALSLAASSIRAGAAADQAPGETAAQHDARMRRLVFVHARPSV
jgi:hypothetical protein